MSGPTAGFARLLEVFSALDIAYMVGGSIAACVHGIPRSTNDVDLIAAVSSRHVTPLVAALKEEFYVDPPEAIHQALSAGRMFNLIHFGSSYKFDIYPLPPEPYHQAAFARRRTEEYRFDEQVGLTFFVASPEDTILAKLVWYRLSNAILERQWSDVLDVVRVQRGRLDLAYLRHWAGPLQVEDLLEEALAAGCP